MKFLSLFSGIEAASVAFMPIGWQCAGVAEIEPFPCAVLKHHYPDVPNLGDITAITREQVEALGPLDLVCGGFPCQDLSVAGKRAGLKHDDGSSTRSGLFFNAMRIVGWTRARWLLIENVPGMLSSNWGRDFAAVVSEMAGCEFGVPANGWGNSGAAVGPHGLVEWATLDAQFFGLAQRRKRVFLVRDSGDWANREPVLLERESMCGNPAPSREAREEVAGTVAGGARKRGGYSADDIPAIAQAFGGNRTSGPLSVSSALSAHGGSGRMDFESETFIAHSLRGEVFDASEDGTGRGTPLVPVYSLALRGRDGGATAELGDDLAFSLRASSGGGDKPHVLAFTCKDHGADAGEIAPTLRSMGHDASHANGGGQVALLTPSMAVRRLTPTECARLQGFSDDHLSILHRRKPAADGPKYKALGNSWATPCIAWIGDQIQAAHTATQMASA